MIIISRVKDAYFQRAKTVAGLLDEELARLINDRQQRLAYTKLFYSEYTVNFVRAHGLIQVTKWRHREKECLGYP